MTYILISFLTLQVLWLIFFSRTMTSLLMKVLFLCSNRNNKLIKGMLIMPISLLEILVIIEKFLDLRKQSIRITFKLTLEEVLLQ